MRGPGGMPFAGAPPVFYPPMGMPRMNQPYPPQMIPRPPRFTPPGQGGPQGAGPAQGGQRGGPAGGAPNGVPGGPNGAGVGQRMGNRTRNPRPPVGTISFHFLSLSFYFISSAQAMRLTVSLYYLFLFYPFFTSLSFLPYFSYPLLPTCSVTSTIYPLSLPLPPFLHIILTSNIAGGPSGRGRGGANAPNQGNRGYKYTSTARNQPGSGTFFSPSPNFIYFI